IYKLTGGSRFQTDYSNASRTQLFNLHTLAWDSEICTWFQIPPECLPEVTDSDGDFGTTDFEGYFAHPIPIRGVLGDSHGALFGQGCHKKGMVKGTYGTGSSVMMNIGDKPVLSSHGVVTSLAFCIGGKVDYVLEGNINYTGAVITWLKNDVKLIASEKETEALALSANKADKTYLVPAFSGLGAPYWDSDATASVSGITRITGKAEIVRAALDCIAYQITDIIRAMSQDAGIPIEELRADGGPTGNSYLMQFQSDIAGVNVQVSKAEELSGIGAAYLAGISLGIFNKEQIFHNMRRQTYLPAMDGNERDEKYKGWKSAVSRVLTG
ncbi:MAG TPA: FGGY-family carbohydrate kinase, partial [Lachnospiraceae bacterium]|nr:FGGY-family carbohydrate kinase [Lachnospiraceae bacterium]